MFKKVFLFSKHNNLLYTFWFHLRSLFELYVDSFNKINIKFHVKIIVMRHVMLTEISPPTYITHCNVASPPPAKVRYVINVWTLRLHLEPHHAF